MCRRYTNTILCYAGEVNVTVRVYGASFGKHDVELAIDGNITD